MGIWKTRSIDIKIQFNMGNNSAESSFAQRGCAFLPAYPRAQASALVLYRRLAEGKLIEIIKPIQIRWTAHPG
jgi:hypothetical protein